MAVESIGSTGRDHATIQAWLDSHPATLTQEEVGEMHDDSVFNITSQQTSVGITTSSTNRLILRAAAGKSFNDNLTTSDVLQYDDTQGVAMHSTTSYLGSMIIIATATHYDIEGLQMQGEGSQSCNCINDTRGSQAGMDVNVRRCILEGTAGSTTQPVIGTSSGTTDTDNWSVINCLIIGRGTASEGAVRQFARGQLIGCTIVGVAASPTGDAVFGDSSTGKGGLINCAVFGFGDPTNAVALDITNCETDNSSWPATGTKTNAGVSKTYADQFEDIVGGSGEEDWRTKSGADLVDAGTDDAAQDNEDIILTTRTNGSFDIGCFELEAAAADGTRRYRISSY